jgi:hypothetical protein
VSKKYWDEIEMPLGMSWRTSWEHIGKKTPKKLLVTLSFTFPQKISFVHVAAPSLWWGGIMVVKFHDQRKPL